MITRFPQSSPAVPTANATVDVYDDKGSLSNNAAVGTLVLYADKSLTLTTFWAAGPGKPLMPRQATTYASTAVRATRTITCVAKANLTDNDFFTVNDGIHTAVVFEYKVTAGFVATVGRTTVDVSAVGVVTDVQVAVVTAAAINAALLDVTCPVPVTAAITATTDYSTTGYTLTITENVANAGFVIGALTATVTGAILVMDFELFPGRNVVRVTAGATAPGEFACAVELCDVRGPRTSVVL